MRKTTRRQALAGLGGLLCAPAWLATPALAQADNPSGLPLPRFATTRSDPINVRVGPGTKYEVAWTYLKSGIPVEIVQEFDTWRKIRDVDGTEGWVVEVRPEQNPDLEPLPGEEDAVPADEDALTTFQL